MTEPNAHYKAAFIKQNYGLTMDQFDAMRKEQRDRCAICGVYMEPPVIDHDHITSKVRKLLCRSCNSGLGMFKDDIRRLARAIVYLEDHGKEY